MAKKKAKNKFSAGTRIRVKEGISSPEFPEISINGWTGTITEIAGKKSQPKYMIEWDEPTLEKMPPEYLEKCEQDKLYHKMACLGGEEIESLEE